MVRSRKGGLNVSKSRRPDLSPHLLVSPEQRSDAVLTPEQRPALRRAAHPPPAPRRPLPQLRGKASLELTAVFTDAAWTS